MAITNAREAARGLIALLGSEFSKSEIDRKRIVVSFSGGLDSTLLAKLAIEHADVSGIVVGMEGSIDLRNARKSAGIIGIELLEIDIDEEIMAGGVKGIINATGSMDPLTISFELPVFLAMQSAKEKVVVTGQGADELFGGYAKYRGLSEDEFISMRKEDMSRVLGPISRIEEAMAVSLGKTVLRPFLGDDVVSFAMSLPTSMILPASERKVVIREALREFGMEEVASMDKKAAQYGSGTSALLRKAAKRQGMSVGEFIVHLKGD